MALFNRRYWWFNTKTGQVEHGKHSKIADLLGPYRTREEAEKAYEIAKLRNAQWVEQLSRDQPRQAQQLSGSELAHLSRFSSPEITSAKPDPWSSWQDFLDEPARHTWDKHADQVADLPSPVTDRFGGVAAKSDPHDPQAFEKRMQALRSRQEEFKRTDPDAAGSDNSSDADGGSASHDDSGADNQEGQTDEQGNSSGE